MSDKKLTCIMCEKSFPTSEFRLRPPNKDGSRYYDRRCKRCNALRARAHRQSQEGRYVIAYHVAKRREIPWNITREEYAALVSQPCDYCGYPLPPEGVGLDRLDLYGDYSPSNVVPCCTECNLARGVWFSPDEMKLIGTVIRQIKDTRIANSQPVMLHRGWGRPRIHT